jgi:hypothetical protein
MILSQHFYIDPKTKAKRSHREGATTVSIKVVKCDIQQYGSKMRHSV